MKKILKKIFPIVIAFAITFTALPFSHSMPASATESMTGNFNTGYTLSGNPASDIATVAEAQVGKTQYQLGYSEGWCADFVCDCAIKIGQSTAIPLYGGVQGLYERIINAGGYEVASPQRGDIIFYINSEGGFMHTAVMCDATYAVSGNIVNDISSVVKHDYTWYLNYSYAKFLRPNYGGSSTPQYSYTAISDGEYFLRNLSDERYLDISNAVDANYTNVQTYLSNGTVAQTFSITNTGNNSYKMRPLISSTRIVNVYSESPVAGDNVDILTDLNDITQWWYFECVDSSTGCYMIHNAYNQSVVLDVSDTNVYVNNRSGAASQLWILEKNEYYTVSYNANGGSSAPASQSKRNNCPLKLSTEIPTREGYSFLGWAESANASSAKYTAGATYTENRAITLYAVWKLNAVKVKLDANGGSWESDTVTEYNAAIGSSITLPTAADIAPKKYYNFEGWSTSKTATTAEYAPGSELTVSSAVTLYAVYSLPEALSDGEEKAISLAGCEERVFTFTPSENAYYDCNVKYNYYTFYYKIQTSDYKTVIDTYEHVPVYLEKGVTYFFVVYTNSTGTEKRDTAATVKKTDITEMSARVTNSVIYQTHSIYFSDLDIELTIKAGDEIVFSGDSSELRSATGYTLSYIGVVDGLTVGTHSLELSIGSLKCTVEYEITESPVQSVVISQNGTYIQDYNYGFYNFIDLKVSFKDGSKISGDYNDVSYDIKQKYGNISNVGYYYGTLNVGENTICIRVMGTETEFSFTVTENPVKELTAVTSSVKILEGDYGYYNAKGKFCVNDLPSILKRFPVTVKINYTDGSSADLKISEEETSLNGIKASAWLNSSDKIQINYYGRTITVSLEVIENPYIDRIASVKVISLPVHKAEFYPSDTRYDVGGSTIEITFESGETQLATLPSVSYTANGMITHNEIKYQFHITNYCGSKNIELEICGITVLLTTIECSDKTITGYELLTVPDCYEGIGGNVRIFFNDGTFADTVIKEVDISHSSPTFFSGEWFTDLGYWVSIYYRTDSDYCDYDDISYRSNLVHDYATSPLTIEKAFKATESRFISKELAYMAARLFKGNVFDGSQTLLNSDAITETATSSCYAYNIYGSIGKKQIESLVNANFVIDSFDYTLSSYYDPDTEMIDSYDMSLAHRYDKSITLFYEDSLKYVYRYAGDDYTSYVTVLKDGVKISYVGSDSEKAISNADSLDDFEYTVSNGGIVITGYKGTKTNIVIGNEYTVDGKTYPVTEIADSAFEANKTIKSVIIPAGVTKIGDYAFYDCTALETVTVNGKNTVIGENALGLYYISRKENGVNEGFTIKGRADSYAQAYANSFTEIAFEALETEVGDINEDGKIDIIDLIRLKKYLSGANVTLGKS